MEFFTKMANHSVPVSTRVAHAIEHVRCERMPETRIAPEKNQLKCEIDSHARLKDMHVEIRNPFTGIENLALLPCYLRTKEIQEEK